MSFPPLKVLIFSVSIGAGHDSVAKALAREIQAKSPDSQVMIVDTFKYINSILNKVVVGSYMETIKFTPKVWGYLYDQAADGERLVDLGQILSKLLSPKLDQLLKEFEPDALVCTHAFPTGILSVLKNKKYLNTPLIACVTDFHIHSFWLHSQVDLYVIPDKDVVHRYVTDQYELEKFRDYGIPIRSQFLETSSQPELKKQLGLKDEFTVLVMGGGMGLGKIEDIVYKLINESNLQILVVTGSNHKLKTNLEQLKVDGRLHVYGYVDNIHELMQAADILLTKPGGVTSAEALAIERPLVIISPLPGQEDINTHYLLNRGVAIKIRKIDNLMLEVNSLIKNPLRLKHMKEMAAYLKKPDAAIKTVEAIRNLIEKKKTDNYQENAF